MERSLNLVFNKFIWKIQILCLFFYKSSQTYSTHTNDDSCLGMEGEVGENVISDAFQEKVITGRMLWKSHSKKETHDSYCTPHVQYSTTRPTPLWQENQ